jgi:glutathione reductase (NADPH)
MAEQQRHYDLVIIGTGSAASAAAFRCRAAGWTVAVIDARPFGGTCALRGCHPKKMLVSAAEVIDATARMAGKGVQTSHVTINWQELMRFKRSETVQAPSFFEHNFARVGIEGFHGRAHFGGPTTVAVGRDLLVGRHVLIATGAMPAALPFPGAEHLTLSDQFLELEALPPTCFLWAGGILRLNVHISRCGPGRVSPSSIGALVRYRALSRTSSISSCSVRGCWACRSS